MPGPGGGTSKPFKITAGPSKMDLMFALFEQPPKPVKIKHEPLAGLGSNTESWIIVTFLRRVNPGGESWSIGAMLILSADPTKPFIWSDFRDNDHTKIDVTIEYDCQKRKGKLFI